MMLRAIDAAGRQLLAQFGFVFQGSFQPCAVSQDLCIETPVSVDAELNFASPLHIGAFSHLNGGFIQNVSIGRYCSFARDIKIGHGSHPVDWLSVSPLQHNPGYRGWLKKAGCAPIACTPFTWGQHTVIGSDVWLGNGVFIADGITIGDSAVVGAQSVVTHDIPPYAIVVGNPARVILMRFADNIIERLLKAAWWRYAISDFNIADFSDIHAALASIEEAQASGMLQAFAPPTLDAATLMRLASPAA